MMVALIIAKTSEGKTRTCNSRCYGAKYPSCACCCGGINHGIGFSEAVRSTRELSKEILANLDITTIKLPLEEVKPCHNGDA